MANGWHSLWRIGLDLQRGEPFAIRYSRVPEIILRNTQAADADEWDSDDMPELEDPNKEEAPPELDAETLAYEIEHFAAVAATHAAYDARLRLLLVSAREMRRERDARHHDPDNQPAQFASGELGTCEAQQSSTESSVSDNGGHAVPQIRGGAQIQEVEESLR
ncbi:hypothetical protein C8J57DRAFT_1506096 [Mycena rebaudengoi]|nr:hypothetical protein C8J57DRAFT_1506096 [Mycena rebaudengoi]